MTNEEVVKAIDNMIDYLLAYKYQRQENDVEALRIARDLVESQPKWIPVSERLPEDYSCCLCTIRNHYTYDNRIEVYNHVVVYNSDEKEWLDDSSKLAFDVVAWMPLPQPYKAESEGVNERGN